METIQKENKSIDDLLNWNREVTQLVNNVNYAREVEIICEDFKIFNPLNEKLVSNSTFPNIERFRVGLLDDEKFPKYETP